MDEILNLIESVSEGFPFLLLKEIISSPWSNVCFLRLEPNVEGLSDIGKQTGSLKFVPLCIISGTTVRYTHKP